MASVTFGGVQIGDATNGLLKLMAGDITRAVVLDELLGRDGVITRNRGGGIQRIVVRAIKTGNADWQTTVTYVENLLTALGTAKGALVAGGRTWPNCMWESSHEEEVTKEAVLFTLTFVRSAFGDDS